MQYAFIQRHKTCWPVSLQGELLGESPSGHHDHVRQYLSRKPGTRMSNDALLVHVQAAHAQSRGEFGWPRVWRELLVRAIPGARSECAS